MKRGAPGPEGSLGKWHWAEVNQALTELAMDVGGRAQSPTAVDLPLPARPRELDRGRHDRDPQEHRRRARPGAARGMNFDLSDDQRTIKRTAREFLPRATRSTRCGGSRSRTSAASPSAVGRDGRSSAGPELGELGTVELIVRGRGARLRRRARRRCRPRGRHAAARAAGEDERLAGGGAARSAVGRPAAAPDAPALRGGRFAVRRQVAVPTRPRRRSVTSPAGGTSLVRRRAG
jgi:hypothetical protein